MRRGIGQNRDDLLELINAARPSVQQQQRLGIGTASRFVDEVDAGALDIHLEMREAIHLALVGAPVVARAPILNQLFEIREVGAVGPAGVGDLSGQPRARKPLPQIGEHLVGNRDGEFFRLAMCHRCVALLAHGLV